MRRRRYGPAQAKGSSRVAVWGRCRHFEQGGSAPIGAAAGWLGWSRVWSQARAGRGAKGGCRLQAAAGHEPLAAAPDQVLTGAELQAWA